MESSEEEDDLPNIESIIPQSKVDSLHQSHTEKGIRKLCCELLDLKDAVENLCGNMQTKYLAFLRISEEAKETQHELIELRKHISSQGILVQDLMIGVSRELEEWNLSGDDSHEAKQDSESVDLEDPTQNKIDAHKIFLEKVDVLLAEHKIEEALDALDMEERNSTELKTSVDALSAEGSSYKSSFLSRKTMLENQLLEISEQPSISVPELKKTLARLIRLGKGPLAHQQLLKFYGSRIQKSIGALLPSCSICPRTYPATLSKLVFSIISLTIKESGTIFGDDPVYTNRIVQWAEWEIEYFVRLIKENAPSSETVSALRAASVCVQASLNYCVALESQGLKLSKLVLVLLRPFIEEVLELNFRRARKFVMGLVEPEENLACSPRFVAPLSTFAPSSDNSVVIDSGIRFMCVVEDLLEQLTPLIILHFGGNILTRLGHLFDKYMDSLIKALPGPLDDDNITELKEGVAFRAETDSEQLSILGMAFTILDELLPNSVVTVWQQQSRIQESKGGPTEGSKISPSASTELKEWKRHLQHSFDKLRDHFCRQYVLSFIYSREGKTRLNAQIYLSGNGEDLHRDSDPLPSLPFQALFAKLQQLATVAGDVLLGKEKIQKILLARLTETVVMWLSDEQEFWSVFEDSSASLHPLGLQQLILDMHFTVEIARFAGYPSRHVHQIASAITARAIAAFSTRGINPNSALPEDEWFVETAKSAINKMLSGAEGSETSDIDEEDLFLHEDIVSNTDDTVSSLSSEESFQSFVSATMGELDSLSESTDPES